MLKKFVLLIFLLALSCSKDNLGKKYPAFFVNKDGSKSKTLMLAIAKTYLERQKGLMYVKDMPDNVGMLFIFPEEKQLSFWMKNTFISLDMIFLDKAKTVVGILENVPILNEKPRSVSNKSQFVVELNSGITKKMNIEKGSKLFIDQIF